MIALEQIHYQYDNFRLYFDINILAKEKVVIIGPSGAGKSTLLSLIAGFISPQSGQIILNYQNVTNLLPAKRPVSMLFQDNNLFSHFTVEQNIALGLKPSLKINPTEQNIITNILAKVGLNDFAKRYPDQLSGGQRQRVALARCLIQQHPILLLDEPFSSLDQALRFEMLELVNEISDEFALTLMMVSHYLDDSLKYFSRCLVVNQGNIIFNAAPEQLKQPENQSIARLLGFYY